MISKILKEKSMSKDLTLQLKKIEKYDENYGLVVSNLFDIVKNQFYLLHNFKLC